MFFMGVNTLFNALMNTPGFERDRFLTPEGHGGRRHGAAERGRRALEADYRLRGLAGLGPDRGIAGGVRHAHWWDRMPDSPAPIGLPVPSTEVTIRDDDGRELAIGAVGEICVRGPQVMRGYWNRADETAKVMLPDGWLRTGDIGRIDERGFVFIEDRKKDMIIVSGLQGVSERSRGRGRALSGRARSRGGGAGR